MATTYRSARQLELLFQLCHDLINQDLVPVRFDGTTKFGGYCNPEAIFLKTNMDMPFRLYALLHEVAHWVIHIGPDPISTAIYDHDIWEFEANLVARELYARFGLGSPTFSDPRYNHDEMLRSRQKEYSQPRVDLAVDRIWDILEIIHLHFDTLATDHSRSKLEETATIPQRDFTAAELKLLHSRILERSLAARAEMSNDDFTLGGLFHIDPVEELVLKLVRAKADKPGLFAVRIQLGYAVAEAIYDRLGIKPYPGKLPDPRSREITSPEGHQILEDVWRLIGFHPEYGGPPKSDLEHQAWSASSGFYRDCLRLTQGATRLGTGEADIHLRANRLIVYYRGLLQNQTAPYVLHDATKPTLVRLSSFLTKTGEMELHRWYQGRVGSQRDVRGLPVGLSRWQFSLENRAFAEIIKARSGVATPTSREVILEWMDSARFSSVRQRRMEAVVESFWHSYGQQALLLTDGDVNQAAPSPLIWRRAALYNHYLKVLNGSHGLVIYGPEIVDMVTLDALQAGPYSSSSIRHGALEDWGSCGADGTYEIHITTLLWREIYLDYLLSRYWIGRFYRPWCDSKIMGMRRRRRHSDDQIILEAMAFTALVLRKHGVSDPDYEDVLVRWMMSREDVPDTFERVNGDFREFWNEFGILT